MAEDDGALKAFFDAKFKAGKIARELNKRYLDGYLERKVAMKAARAVTLLSEQGEGAG